MALSINSYITDEEFNNLKTRVINEMTRRSSSNIYNNNAFTTITNIANQIDKDHIVTPPYNQILDFFNKFNLFPDDLNQIYHDGNVQFGDIIYDQNTLNTIMGTLEQEPRVNNNDCNSGCMGLCTNSCNDSCTGCTGSCKGGCKNTCVGVCKDNCEGGCKGCTGTCSGGCLGGCTNCSGSCSGSCETGCKGACNGTCTGACEGTGRSNADNPNWRNP